MTGEAVVPSDADVDGSLAELLADLPQAWARTAVGDEIATVARFLRAAYGRGYMDALERPGR